MNSYTVRKERYIDFYSQHPDICIFSSPWWLDAVCGVDNWDVIIIEKNGHIQATFPYYINKGKLGMKSISMPMLTQKMGPYIVYEKNLTSVPKRISYEHDIYERIISAMPKFSSFNINFSQEYKNWLPFYWRGFSQTTRYSYQIHNIKNHENVLKNFTKSKKYEVPKARKVLTLKYDLPADDFYDYFMAVVKGRKDTVSYSRELFKNIYEAVYKNNAGRCFYCEDSLGNIHAINLTVWDNKTAYYLIAMRKKEFNTSGGTEFLVYETIKYVSQFVDTFDFEGSMMKGVEASYRNYGGVQTEYYNISKDNNTLIPLVRDGLHLLSAIKHKIMGGGTTV